VAHLNKYYAKSNQLFVPSVMDKERLIEVWIELIAMLNTLSKKKVLYVISYVGSI